MKLLPAIGMLGLPAIGFSQWVHYPTAGVPRKADGTPNLAAPVPRLADGKPDFSGIWHTARLIPCDAELSRFINCEIGGSPLARNFGLDMPGRLAAGAAPFARPEPGHTDERQGKALVQAQIAPLRTNNRKLHFKFPPGGDTVQGINESGRVTEQLCRKRCINGSERCRNEQGRQAYGVEVKVHGSNAMGDFAINLVRYEYGPRGSSHPHPECRTFCANTRYRYRPQSCGHGPAECE